MLNKNIAIIIATLITAASSLLILFFLYQKNGTPVEELQAGDCLQDAYEIDQTTDPENPQVKTTSCDKPHVQEVLSVHKKAFEKDAPYPGQREYEQVIRELCESSFEEKTQEKYSTSELELEALLPSESAWQQGNRQVVCLTHLKDKSTVEESFLSSI